MPQVVQIQRQPNSWDQAGQTVQQTADNFLKSMLTMGQMQNNNALHMATLNMQNQRIADTNTRQDKQLAAADAARKEEMAQRAQFHGDSMSLQRDALNRQYAAMNKSQLVTVKGPDGSDMPVLFNPMTQKVTPFSMPGIGGGAGGAMGGGSSIPGLDAAISAGMNEVLSPGWSPTTGGGQNSGPSLAELGVRAGILPVPQNDNAQSPANDMQGATFTPQTDTRPASQLSLAELGQRAGVLPSPQDNPQFGQQPAQAKPASQLSTYELGQRAGIFPSPQPQTAASALAPGTVVDGSGKPVQVPDNYAWGKQEKQYVNGVEYYGARTPNGVYFKVGGPVPLTPAEKKDQRTVDKMDNMDAAAKQSGQNVLGMIQQARNLVGQGNAYGVIPNTGMGSLLNWIPGTTGKDLETTLNTIKGNIGFDKLQQMRANSPTGAALGAVSDFENKMLQSTIASLETSQSKEQFLTNLKRVEDAYNMIVHGLSYRGQQQGGNAAQLPQGFRLVN